MLAALKALAIVVVIGLSGCAATVTQPTAEARPLAASATPTGVALLITGSPTVLASTNWHIKRTKHLRTRPERLFDCVQSGSP